MVLGIGEHTEITAVALLEYHELDQTFAQAKQLYPDSELWNWQVQLSSEYSVR